MIRTVGGNATHIIQKVFNIIKGQEVTLRFQTIEKARIGKVQADNHTSIHLARQAIDAAKPVAAIETAPKADYADQQTGYSRSK